MTEKEAKEWYCQSKDCKNIYNYSCMREKDNCESCNNFIKIGKEKGYIQKSKLEEFEEYYNRATTAVMGTSRQFKELYNLAKQAIEEARQK